MSDLPQEVLDQLIAMPETKPEPFVCKVCQQEADNKWHWSPRDYERPPICKRCEGEYTTISYSWNGRNRSVQKPKAGAWRDRRELMRLYAVAEALHSEAARMKYYGRT